MVSLWGSQGTVRTVGVYEGYTSEHSLVSLAVLSLLEANLFVRKVAEESLKGAF